MNSQTTLLLFEVLTHCKQNRSTQCIKRRRDVIAGFKETVHHVQTYRAIHCKRVTKM